MSILYLHCGLPKTGTTSIQRVLARSRKELGKRGYGYPKLGMSYDRIAHHNFARQIGGSRDFRPGRGSTQDLLSYIKNTERPPNTVLSSEGFTNCLCASASHGRFMEFVRELKHNSDALYVVFTFRRFSHFFESVYLSKLKTGMGGSNGAHPTRVPNAQRWLKNFFDKLGELRDFIGPERLVVSDVEEGEGNSVKAFLSILGVSNDLGKNSITRRNARLGLKKTAFIHRLQYSPDGTRYADWSPRDVMRACMSVEAMAEFPDEIVDYRVIAYDKANAIQELAREMMPPYLAKPLKMTVRKEEMRYSAVKLQDIELTSQEFEAMRSALPQELAQKVHQPD